MPTPTEPVNDFPLDELPGNDPKVVQMVLVLALNSLGIAIDPEGSDVTVHSVAAEHGDDGLPRLSLSYTLAPEVESTLVQAAEDQGVSRDELLHGTVAEVWDGLLSKMMSDINAQLGAKGLGFLSKLL